jgi:hypothetical protein
METICTEDCNEELFVSIIRDWVSKTWHTYSINCQIKLDQCSGLRWLDFTRQAYTLL